MKCVCVCVIDLAVRAVATHETREVDTTDSGDADQVATAAEAAVLRVVATVAACSSSANIVLRGNGNATMKLRHGKSARQRKRLNRWTRTRCL